MKMSLQNNSKFFSNLNVAIVGSALLIILLSVQVRGYSQTTYHQHHHHHQQQQQQYRNHRHHNHHRRQMSPQDYHNLIFQSQQIEPQQRLLNSDDMIDDNGGEFLEQFQQTHLDQIPPESTLLLQDSQQEPQINQSSILDLDSPFIPTTTTTTTMSPNFMGQSNPTTTAAPVFYQTTTTAPEMLFQLTTTTTTTAAPPLVLNQDTSVTTTATPPKGDEYPIGTTTTTTTPTSVYTTTNPNDQLKQFDSGDQQQKLSETQQLLTESDKEETTGSSKHDVDQSLSTSAAKIKKVLDQELTNQIAQEISESTESKQEMKRNKPESKRIKAAVYTRYSIVNADDFNSNEMFSHWSPLKESYPEWSHSAFSQQKESSPTDGNTADSNYNQNVPIIEVIPQGGRPLEIHFKSSTKRIRLVQSTVMDPNDESRNREEPVIERSEEKPQQYFHRINKPIIQEVREIIMPYRKVYQEIRPVQEEINTIVSSSRSQRPWSNVNNKFNTLRNSNVDKQQQPEISPIRTELSTKQSQSSPQPQLAAAVVVAAAADAPPMSTSIKTSAIAAPTSTIPSIQTSVQQKSTGMVQSSVGSSSSSSSSSIHSLNSILQNLMFQPRNGNTKSTAMPSGGAIMSPPIGNNPNRMYNKQLGNYNNEDNYRTNNNHVNYNVARHGGRKF